MNRPCLLAFSAAALLTAASAQTPSNPFAGRWDLTLKTPTETYPSWLEVSEKDGHPTVSIVGRVASAHPASEVKLDGSHLTFTSTEHFGKPTKVVWDLTAANGKLRGTQNRENVKAQLTGVAAPKLERTVKAWGKPEPLFNGKDLAGWEPIITEPGKPVTSNWQAENGELVNRAPGANIRTTRTFQDFKLHVEFNCPAECNSGVYLRGRDEVQVEYAVKETNDKFHGMGSIYGFLAPSVALPKKPGQWETFDITLVGRKVTVVRDGVTTIDNQEIPGITGGALDSHEGEPGPIYLQGDHTGGMKYRNLTIAQPKR